MSIGFVLLVLPNIASKIKIFNNNIKKSPSYDKARIIFIWNFPFTFLLSNTSDLILFATINLYYYTSNSRKGLINIAISLVCIVIIIILIIFLKFII